jgi:hypothetical protein
MVTRKPLPQSPNASLGSQPSSPPYPVTPAAAAAPTSFRMQDTPNNLGKSMELEREEDENAWSGERLTKKQEHDPTEVPQALRVGPPGFTVQKSREMLRLGAASTNPLLQKQNQNETKESSASAWNDFDEKPTQPSHAPPPPPFPKGKPPRYA